MEMVSKKITCVALLCMLVIAVAPRAEALTCGTVVGALTPCLGYLQGGQLSGSCCGGIKSLVAQATTTADRRTACNCLKAAAGSIRNIDYGKAAGLPGKCGANIPYKISPSTNCNSVN